MIAGKYELQTSKNSRVWLSEINLALGYEQGKHVDWGREWLYWYDRSGDRNLTDREYALNAEAIANRDRLIASQERIAKQEAEQKMQRFVEKLKALGINPDEV